MAGAEGDVTPFVGCVVKFRHMTHRTWILWDKKGGVCWLVEDFSGIGPRRELYAIQVSWIEYVRPVPVNQHRRWFS